MILDPTIQGGTIILEFHGYHNESANTRMHIELTRTNSEHWYAYWIDQFDQIWQTAQQPTAT